MKSYYSAVRYCIITYCQLIRDLNKQKRLAWAIAHQKDTFHDVMHAASSFFIERPHAFDKTIVNRVAQFADLVNAYKRVK